MAAATKPSQTVEILKVDSQCYHIWIESSEHTDEIELCIVTVKTKGNVWAPELQEVREMSLQDRLLPKG